MSLHHQASVCSCNNCKSNECFVKRKTLCACSDTKSFITKPNEDLCCQYKKKIEPDLKVCHQSGKDIVDADLCCQNKRKLEPDSKVCDQSEKDIINEDLCCRYKKNFETNPKVCQQSGKDIIECVSVNSKVQQNKDHSENTLTEHSLSGTNRNDELIKVLNETITEKLRSDVRELLEEFRKSLIEITTKESYLKVINRTETNKQAECCPAEVRSSSKTLTSQQETNEPILLTPPEVQECHSQGKSIDKTKKIDHLIETAKLIKLGGGVEFRHEQFFRNYGDPNKKYGELITKDEIRTTKTFNSNVNPVAQKSDKKDDRKDDKKDGRKDDKKNHKKDDKNDQKLGNLNEKKSQNNYDKPISYKTNCKNLRNETATCCNLSTTYTTGQVLSSNEPTKPWRCMIIEDISSDATNKSSNPSYYILEQSDFSKKPEIISLEYDILSEYEQHVLSIQAVVPPDPIERSFVESERQRPSVLKKEVGVQTVSSYTAARGLKDDCLCRNTLEEYLKELSDAESKPDAEPNYCCIARKNNYVSAMDLEDEEPINSIINKNNQIPIDNIEFLLKSLMAREQQYRCKCSIEKSQCHALHCCDKNEDICILEKVRAQANRVQEESKKSYENTKSAVLCNSCKKKRTENISNENKISPSNQNNNCCFAVNPTNTEAQPQNNRAVYSCDMCGMNQNKNYKESMQCKANSSYTEGNNEKTPSFDKIISKLQITPYDILNKLKEAYKACSCKVCACVSGASKCNETTKKNSTTCQCEPSKTNERETPKPPKTIRPKKWAVRGISHQSDPMKDLIFGLGKLENSCTCLPCDCLKCSKLDGNHCACSPCECLQCNSKGGKCISEKPITVAPVEEELRRNICTCDPCRCASCGISTARVSTTWEVSTETGQRACACAVCQNETCRLGATDNCICLGQNTIVTKPVTKDQNFDIRTVLINNKRHSKNCSGSCKKSIYKGSYAAFAALTDNKPHFFSDLTKTENCLCEECQCLACDKQIRALEQNENKINIYNCKCSTCECEVCPSQKTNHYVKQCQCNVCECIECETMPRSNSYIRNTSLRLPLMNDCARNKIESKHFVLQPNNNTDLKSNTVSQTSTAVGSENPSWSQTTEDSSERTFMPSNSMKHMGVNDIPTKDEPNLFNPENNYIQDVINYKTRSFKTILDDKLQVPVPKRLFTPPPSSNNINSIVTYDKNTHHESAKPILPRKKMFFAGKTEKNSNENSKTSSIHKSSLNLLAKSDEFSKKNFGSKWVKESDFVLRRCETKSHNFASSYLKRSNVQYVKSSDILMNAKILSSNLLKILEKYEKANQEFQSITSKCLMKQYSDKQDMINESVGYLYNLSTLYQNKSDLSLNTPGTLSYALDVKESLTKGGFVLDMRRQNTHDNVMSVATVPYNREAFETCNDIIIKLVNSLNSFKTQNTKKLSKVRTVLNLSTNSNYHAKIIEKSNTENLKGSKYDRRNKSKEKCGLKIMSSVGLIPKKPSRNEKIALTSQKRSNNSLKSEERHKETEDNKKDDKSVSRALSTYDSKSSKLENSRIESAEENVEIEVTVCVSTADIHSLGSMEGNYVYVINNNRHPIRDYLEDPSMHILKKCTHLDEALYPKLSAAYPSMQFDIKNTLHSRIRHDSNETGPSSTRHMLHTMTMTERKVVETTSLIASKNIVLREESRFLDDSLNSKMEEEKRRTSLHSQRAVTPIRSILLNEQIDHQTCEIKSSSFEALKAHFQGVTRISNHTAIIKWNKPKCLVGVCGYELLIDGKPVKTGLGPTRCMAIVTCIPQSEKIQLTIRTIVEMTNGIKHYTTSTTEYHPRINS